MDNNLQSILKFAQFTKVFVSESDLYQNFISEILVIFDKYYNQNNDVSYNKILVSLIISEVFNKFINLETRYSINNLNSIFSYYKMNLENLDIDDNKEFSMFVAEIKSCINTYPFSITNYDVDNLTIKPNVLSRLVETLLSQVWSDNDNNIRKTNGVFFTPVEVIDYINKNTLCNYLQTFCHMDSEREYIKSLINDNDTKFYELKSLHKKEFSEKNNKIDKKLIDLLNKVKIIDPAMGASDFLVSYTNLLFSTLQRLNAVPKDDELGFVFCEDTLIDNGYLYKKIIWENNIYGIDIENISIEASVYRGLLDALCSANNLDIELIEFNFILDDSVLIGSADNESEFIESFDIVVGNPPYINFKNMTQEKKDKYCNLNYSTFTTQTDLYILFYELGFNLLKNNGHLMYITSDKWLKSRYGLQLRNFFLENTYPKKLIELGDNIFEDAAVDTNILMFSKTNYKKPTKVLKFNNDLQNLQSIEESNFTKIRFKRNTNWLILNSIELNIMKKLEAKSQKINDLSTVKIRRGILTGLNKAYIINKETRNSILESSISEKERKLLKEIIVPIINGKDIRKNKINWSGNFLINFHNGFTRDGKYNAPLNIEDFPSLKNYFSNYEYQLQNRSDKGNSFYNLRNCAYINEFTNTKIIWPEISSDVTFVEDNKGFFIGTSAYMMINYPKWLLSYLNSSLFKWYFSKHSLTLGSKANRFTKQFIENSLIPNTDLYNLEDFYDFYELTEEEIYYIKNYFL